MQEYFVIIHGWSDKSSSFKKMAQFIQKNLNANVTNINLGDWISMNDDVTYADIAEAMNRAWISHGLPTNKRSVNIIVHSTGALIAREWMTRFYNSETVPIKRFLMLAPANFGSPLAHKGRTFIGRAVKGWRNDGFETGKVILNGLELASPYTWDLAHKDLFTSEEWYGENKILATVLIGNVGYSGLSAIANETGSDGTVRISTANLNSTKIRIELDEHQTPRKLEMIESQCKVGFGILDKVNHSTITLNETLDSKIISPLQELILRSLQITDEEFRTNSDGLFPWQSEISLTTGDTVKYSSRMQNAVVKASDNLGNIIEDYFVEFYRTEESDEEFEQELYTKFIESVHTYEANGSYRALYLNISELEKLKGIKSMAIKQLFISITAQPIYLEKTIKNQPVGYLPIEANSTGGLKLSKKDIDLVFKPHRTVLFEITLTRKLSENVFKLTNNS